MNYTIESIAGYKREKGELARLCEIFANREKYTQKGAKLPKGIIFYGPVGTGKTLFAKVMASMCKLNIRSIDIGEVSDDMSIINRISKVFSRAEKRSTPTMIFFDEIDKFLPNYSEEYVTDRSKTILAQLLSLIDGMNSSGKVIFVATANSYQELPEALVRPGRIDKKIALPNPDFASRCEILKLYLGRTSCRFEPSTEETAQMCVGMSCASIETLVNECILASDSSGIIRRDVILEKIAEIKSERLPRKNSPLTDKITACRNIGYYLASRAFNRGKCILNMENDTLCNNFFNGIMSEIDDDYDYDDDDYEEDDEIQNSENSSETYYYSKSDFLNTIVVIFGGFIAQERFLNKTYDNQKWALNSIDKILENMSQNGMLGMNMVYIHERGEYTLPYTPEHIARVNAEFERIKEECFSKAQKIISECEHLIKPLLSSLLDSRSLNETELDDLIKNQENSSKNSD